MTSSVSFFHVMLECMFLAETEVMITDNNTYFYTFKLLIHMKLQFNVTKKINNCLNKQPVSWFCLYTGHQSICTNNEKI